MALFTKKSEQTQKDDVTSSTASNAPVTVVANTPFAIIQPRISEKSVQLNKMGKYVFLVSLKSNKVEVKKAIEKAYKVHVTQVNIIRNKTKAIVFGRFQGTRSAFKKAVVTLKKGESIDAESK